MHPAERHPLPVTWADACVVRDRIARGWLGAEAGDDADDAPPDDATTFRLRPHQRVAVARIREAFREFGGALLADETGLGKTYVALALAAGEPGALVVAPASLRAMWRDAMRRSGVERLVVTHERLSRGPSSERPPLVIVDEAHHARNPATRRWAHLSALCAGARVLLLSATPVHNRRADLDALLALFLGARAATLGAAELARCVVRRDRAAADLLLPRVEPVRTLHPRADDALLERLLALPPPVPPADGGDGGALLGLSLVRQWASSTAALRGALRRRLVRAAALGAALEEGRLPTAAELRAWTVGDAEVQLALPGLLASGSGDAELLAAVHAHERAAREVLAALEANAGADADAARAALLRDVCDAHAGERVVAFTGYAETADSLYRRLRARGGVALLTGAGARVAGGALSRIEVLHRFAPRAHGAPEPAAAERITLLIATDLLSEGVNLQDASVVVHLDQPWTPARLEQRVGRVARLGSRADRVAVYALEPPAGAEALLAIERRLRAKAGEASRAIGVVGAILPSLVPPGERGAPEAAERLRELLTGWRMDGVAPPGDLQPTVAAALHAGREGVLALCGDGRSLVAALDDRVGDDPRLLLEVARLASDAVPVPADAAALDRALALLDRHARDREAARSIGAVDAGAARTRRLLAARLAAVAHRAPLHRRAALGALVARARPAVTLRCGAGLERVLSALAAADLPDEAWLRALGEFVRLHAAPRDEDARGERGPVAVLLLCR